MALAKYEEDNRLITDERLSRSGRYNSSTFNVRGSSQTISNNSKILEIPKAKKSNLTIIR